MTGTLGSNDKVVSGVDRSVTVEVAAVVQNLAILRTLVSAVAAFEDLDVDSVSDLRLALDEACTQLIRCAEAGAVLTVAVEPHTDAVVVHASTTSQSGEQPVTEGSFSWHVLSSLTDEVRTFAHGRDSNSVHVVGISLTARRVGALR